MKEQGNKNNKIEFPYLFLFSGDDLEIVHCKIHHPTIGDILRLKGIHKEDVYWTYVSVLLCDPYNSMVELDDMGLNYLEVTPFDLFVMNWKKYEQLYQGNKEEFDLINQHPLDTVKSALNFFFGEHDWKLLDIIADNDPILYDGNDHGYQIGKEIYEVFVKFLQQIHCVDFSERIVPKTEFVRKTLIDDMRIERQFSTPKDDSPTNILGSMVSAICIGGNGSVSVSNIHDLRVFQVYQYFIMTQKKDRVDKLMNGIYAGTIDGKSISESDLKWTV